jgi:hypothetical protein
MIDRGVREWIQALDERGLKRDREIAELSARVSRGATDIARLTATVEAIQAELSAQRALPSRASASRPPTGSAPAAAGPPPPVFQPRKPAPLSPAALPSAAGPPPAPPGFASLIVADFPALLAELRGKRFPLLWRGSRDGFGAGDFHIRCDGRTPTLTLIEDTAGNIFGGFTPVEWESNFKLKADPSLKSFVFSLKNPHNFPARKFVLKAEKKDRAIACNSACGPFFNDGFMVYDHCNVNSESHTRTFGGCYANDTGLDGETVLTGAEQFTVKEIEVFAIAD